MGKIVAEISVSLDGYVAGPNPTLENPLGEGGDQLHEWAFPLKSWREPHGLPGGETGPDDELVAESLRSTGAVVMGRRMFSGGDGPWEDDTNANGWWGDNPPFHKPVFVLTHHAREPLVMEGGPPSPSSPRASRARSRMRAPPQPSRMSWSQAERTRSISRSTPAWSTTSCSTSPRCCWAAEPASSTASGPRSPGSR